MKVASTTLALCVGLYSSMLLADSNAPAAGMPAEKAPAAAPAASTQVGEFEGKETICKNGSKVRKVKLGFADIKTGSDCKVSYLKETEEPGAEKVLWNASNDAKFCQEHAQGFVEKLKGQGWSCE